jgi:hypothetical protein
VPAELPEELRRSKSFNVELDAMPGGFVCSASFKGSADNGAIRHVAAGKQPIAELFRKRSEGSMRPRARRTRARPAVRPRPDPDPQAEDQAERFGRRLVGALCLYPNGSQIVELSTKAQPSEAFQVAAEVRAFLTSIGVDLEGKQETKTKTALEFFTRAMQVA